MDMEGFVGDDPLAYAADLTPADTLTDKQAPAMSVAVASDVPADAQSPSTDLGAAPANEVVVEASQSDPTAASATEAPQPDATTAVAAAEEEDEDDVDEDEADEDEEEEAGGEVTPSIVTPEVLPTEVSAAPLVPTANAAETPVQQSGLAVDAAVDPLLNDPLLDTEGFVGDDPLAYAAAADQQAPAPAAEKTPDLKNAPESLTVSSKASLPVEVPSDPGTAAVNEAGVEVSQSATEAPVQPDPTTAAAAEEEGDDDEVDEDDVEEDEEDEAGGEVVTTEVSPTVSAAPPVPTGNAADASVPQSGIAVDTPVAPQVIDPLLDTEGFVGDDPLAYAAADQPPAPAAPDTQANTITDTQALPASLADFTAELSGILGIASTAATSVEILVLPSNIIAVSIEVESPKAGGPGPAFASHESVEVFGLEPVVGTDLPSEPSVAAPGTQAPLPDPTTAAAAVQEEEIDDEEDEDEDDAVVVVDPSAASLQAAAVVSAEAPSDSSQVSAEAAALSASVSAVLTSAADVLAPVDVSVSTESSQLPSDPSATVPAQPTAAVAEDEDDADEEEDEDDEAGAATQAPTAALPQAEALSVSGSSASSSVSSVKTLSDITKMISDPLLSGTVIVVELPSNSTEVSAESAAAVASVAGELPSNGPVVNTEAAQPPQAGLMVSVSIESNPAQPGAFDLPSAAVPGAGLGASVVMEATLPTSSEECLAEQEKAASDPQGNPELAIANPWTEFLRSLGTREPPKAPQQQGNPNARLPRVLNTGITKSAPPAQVAKSSSEEN